jgi:hypothetical protein
MMSSRAERVWGPIIALRLWGKRSEGSAVALDSFHLTKLSSERGRSPQRAALYQDTASRGPQRMICICWGDLSRAEPGRLHSENKERGAVAFKGP